MNTDDNFKILNVDFECTTCKKLEQEKKSIPVGRIIQKLDSFFETNDLLGAENLLASWQKEAVTLGDLKGELSVVNEQLGLYRKMNLPEKAQKAVARAIELLELTNSAQTVSGATILVNAATTTKFLEKPQEALPLYERALSIYKKHLNPNDLLFAAFYNNYATTLVDLKRFDEALECYEKALEITSRRIEGLLDSAVTLVNMAHLFEARDGLESEQIISCLDKAEAVFSDERIIQDSYYAFVAEKCAPSFDYFGYFSAAAKLSKRSKEIYEGT